MGLVTALLLQVLQAAGINSKNSIIFLIVLAWLIGMALLHVLKDRLPSKRRHWTFSTIFTIAIGLFAWYVISHYQAPLTAVDIADAVAKKLPNPGAPSSSPLVHNGLNGNVGQLTLTQNDLCKNQSALDNEGRVDKAQIDNNTMYDCTTPVAPALSPDYSPPPIHKGEGVSLFIDHNTVVGKLGPFFEYPDPPVNYGMLSTAQLKDKVKEIAPKLRDFQRRLDAIMPSSTDSLAEKGSKSEGYLRSSIAMRSEYDKNYRDECIGIASALGVRLKPIARPQGTLRELRDGSLALRYGWSTIFKNGQDYADAATFLEFIASKFDDPGAIK